MTILSQNNLEPFKSGGYFYDRMYKLKKKNTTKQINKPTTFLALVYQRKIQIIRLLTYE